MGKKIITIDGPAGSGKTTVSRRLARKLGWIYVDTGALYRSVAYEISLTGKDWQDEAVLKELLKDITIDVVRDGQGLKYLCNGRDISSEIRTPEISMLASRVSSRPLVRARLLGLQRSIAEQDNAVFEGRDMGTVVFPKADHKFFLSADLHTRALRRHMEMGQAAHEIKEVETAMRLRDEQDSKREEAPLKPAPDAVSIDSTHLTIDQVVEAIISHLKTAFSVLTFG